MSDDYPDNLANVQVPADTSLPDLREVGLRHRVFADSADRDAFLSDYFSGKVRLGGVSLCHFDIGVAESLGARWVVDENHPDRTGFYLTDTGLALAPGMPGVPVKVQEGDDLYRSNILPGVFIKRTSAVPDLRRWQPGNTQYRVPAAGAVPVEINGARGYDRYEERQVPIPYNFEYTIRIQARNRAYSPQLHPAARFNAGQNILRVLSRYLQPLCTIWVRDTSRGPEESYFRDYSAYNEGGFSEEDQVIEVTGRIIGYTLSLRVEGELDEGFIPRETRVAVTQTPSLSLTPRE